jgi:hypothetical protein
MKKLPIVILAALAVGAGEWIARQPRVGNWDRPSARLGGRIRRHFRNAGEAV